jgi:uncharacterized protein YraI
MNIKRFVWACLTSCTALVVTITTALAELATVTSRQLNVRRGPGSNYPVTYTLRQGDRVEVTRRQGSWAFIVGERGGEGWVDARYLSSDTPTPPSGGNATNDVFRSKGTVDNARYKGAGEAILVIGRRDKSASLGLSNAGQFSIEYIGTVRSNFEGTIQLDIEKFRSSEVGYRTVAASGTCNIQASGGSVRKSYCTITGSGIDHGRSNFTGR